MSIIKLPFDLNCDLGEGMPNDKQLMPFLGSCNIACGGHAGTKTSIRATLLLSQSYGVKAGAHPSYPDLENFGRKYVSLSKLAFQDTILTQLALFEDEANELNIHFHHIKPHGALYNRLAVDEVEAAWFTEIMLSVYPNTILYVPPKSVIERKAQEQGVTVYREVFADRSYQDDLTLVPRSHPRALLTDPIEVIAHIRHMIEDKCIETISGRLVPIEADTLCIHGDNPAALEILQALKKTF
jgi:5-oxoprolinase (ATP-hydrolysing) subunit A